ncbi:MAG: AMP-binding protein, partial [Cyclobacteriaceae bacterium]
MIYLLPHTLQSTAERLPDQNAFQFEDEVLTYEEMVLKTNQMAHLLLESGVRRGDRVGVYLQRSIETAIAIYGIMQAGAAYVPLDPYAPSARTLFLLKDCGIRHLITNTSQKRTFPDILTKTSALDQVIGISGDWPVPSVTWEALNQFPTNNPTVRILEQDLAYIMYTSGSTGKPKGIMHTHYSGLNYAKLSADLFGLGKRDRIGSHAPLHFDISTLAYFTAPLVGATSVIISEAHTKMPASLTELMQTEKLTVWYSVPLALTQMLSHGLL